jgi:hypothetical protein
VLKEGKITQLALLKSNGLQENERNHCLGNAENFQIWRAVSTYDQPKISSFSVIGGYVCNLFKKEQRLKQQSKKTVIVSKSITSKSIKKSKMLLKIVWNASFSTRNVQESRTRFRMPLF